MNSKKHILLVGPTDDYYKKSLKCNALVSILTEKLRLSDYQSNSCNNVLIVDFNNIEELILVVLESHKIHPFDCVFSFTELGTVPSGIISSMLDIPGPSLFCSLICRDKFRTRELTGSNLLSKINYKLIENQSGIIDFVEIHGFPVVIKPRDGMGSHSVSINYNLHDALENCKEGYLIESFAPGKEFSCETFSINGQHYIIAVTEKVLGGLSGVVEVGHKVVSKKHIDHSLKLWVNGVLNNIQLRNGVAHIEFKKDNENFHFIECHNRPGGDRIWQLVELATGFDLIRSTINLFLGNNVQVPNFDNRCSEIVYFDFISGIVTDVKHPFEGAPEWVRWYEWKAKEGVEIKPMTDSFDRYGGFIIEANNEHELEARKILIMKEVEVATIENI